jgi:hypothetical protein
MAAKHQKIAIQLPKALTASQREAVAGDVIEHIRKRSRKGLDKNNRPFAKYSKEYTESLDFKVAGKSKKVDLTLSGDMLGAIDLIEHGKGKIVIGFEDGTGENARADGNIRGTYGQKSQTAPKRDFLGIGKSDLNKILAKYPVDDAPKARTEAEKKRQIRVAAGARDVSTEDDDE